MKRPNRTGDSLRINLRKPRRLRGKVILFFKKHCALVHMRVDHRMAVHVSLRRDIVPSNKAGGAEQQEAERKLQELKRRRNDAESEDFEKMKQKQQDAEAELEELKRKREERRKVMEEEEKQKKQEMEDKKAKEQARMVSTLRTKGIVAASFSSGLTGVTASFFFLTGGEEEDEGGDREKEGGGRGEEEAEGGGVSETRLYGHSQRLLKGEFQVTPQQ